MDSDATDVGKIAMGSPQWEPKCKWDTLK